jgi:hypothetical protein
MRRYVYYFGLLAFVMGLWGCANLGSASGGASDGKAAAVKPGVAPIPGGYWMYSFGSGQTGDNFANVEFAQYDYAVWAGRSWKAMGPKRRASANRLGLQSYYPLHVRWKLKDGREFILENIDTAAIMREYFKTHQLQLQWQKEGRPKAQVGDASPTLAHEVKDDTVILKWVITINRTPVDKRLTPTGAANFWDTYDEEYIVAVLKGQATTGLDFDSK